MHTVKSSDLARSSGTILVAEDFEPARRLLETLLARQGYRVLAADGGRQALAMAAADPPDMVLTDLKMPGGDGIELCRALKDEPGTRLIPVVIMTGSSEAGDRVRAIEAGAADFLTKPVEATELEARVRSLVRLKHFTDDLDSAEAVLRSLALTVEARDAYTHGHCERLGDYAVALGERLALRADDLETLLRGGYFHDLGKIAIPDAILLKPGPLTRDEYLKVQEHTVVGDRLCGDLRALRHVRPIVRSHHERLDGSGYPDGLKGDAIPMLAQIIGIVDVYDALTTTRPYRAALADDMARDQLLDEVKRGWRRGDLVEQFLATRPQ
jgi:putative two-component system response regulator